jgi:hypothetical protein
MFVTDELLLFLDKQTRQQSFRFYRSDIDLANKKGFPEDFCIDVVLEQIKPDVSNQELRLNELFAI